MVKLLPAVLFIFLHQTESNSQHTRTDFDGAIIIGNDTTISPQIGTIRMNLEAGQEGFVSDQWLPFTQSASLHYPFGVNKNHVNEIYYIEKNNNLTSNLGYSLSSDQDLLVTGAPSENSQKGGVYVFHRADTGWVEIERLEAGDGSPGDNFGHSVDIFGDFIVVGSPYDDVNGDANRGAVYVFKYNDTSWVEQQKIIAYNGYQNNYFGRSVSITGTTIAIGSPRAFNRGRVYIYDLDNNSWEFTRILQSSDAQPGDDFGYSVSLNDRYLAIGAPENQLNFIGSAYLFYFEDNVWTETQIFSHPNTGSVSRFGYSIATDGNTLVVGAVGRTNSHHGGSAHVYSNRGSSWVNTAYLSPDYVVSSISSNPDGSIDNLFGSSVAINNDIIFVGAPGFQIGPNFCTGHVFQRDGNTWNKIKELNAIGNFYQSGFGNSVTFYNDNIVVGSRSMSKLFVY